MNKYLEEKVVRKVGYPKNGGYEPLLVQGLGINWGEVGVVCPKFGIRSCLSACFGAVSVTTLPTNQAAKQRCEGLWRSFSHGKGGFCGATVSIIG